MNLIYRLLKLRYRRSFLLYRKPPNQTKLLMDMIRKNEQTDYGKRFSFSTIRDKKTYQQTVPIVTYDDLEDYIDRISQGEEAVLTSEAVLLFEPTGGSSGVKQWIPYTKTLKEQFQRSIEAWLYDIYENYPGLAGGKSYWMITPPKQEEKVADSVIPIGFDDDGEYLGSLGKRLMNQLMVQPKLSSGLSTEEFYQITLSALLSEPDLRLISVWNPSLLLGLMDYLKQKPDEVLKRLPKKRRIAIRRAVYQTDYQSIWPKLSLISCWADASAESDAKEIERLFPGVTIQPKGLLSTECLVSFPTRESLLHGGMIPAHASTFLEFRQGGEIYTLDQVEVGQEYEVIVTTGGGLYRYTCGDLVRVTGRLRGIPLLRFVGRLATVDLVGEKMTPAFVAKAFSDWKNFFLLTPNEKGYTFFTDAPIRSAEVEERLSQNHHYALARTLGQLAKVKVFLIEGDATGQYFENCRRFGQRLGDIKPIHLSPRRDFQFRGHFIT